MSKAKFLLNYSVYDYMISENTIQFLKRIVWNLIREFLTVNYEISFEKFKKDLKKKTPQPSFTLGRRYQEISELRCADYSIYCNSFLINSHCFDSASNEARLSHALNVVV